MLFYISITNFKWIRRSVMGVPVSTKMVKIFSIKFIKWISGSRKSVHKSSSESIEPFWSSPVHRKRLQTTGYRQNAGNSPWDISLEGQKHHLACSVLRTLLLQVIWLWSDHFKLNFSQFVKVWGSFYRICKMFFSKYSILSPFWNKHELTQGFK